MNGCVEQYKEYKNGDKQQRKGKKNVSKETMLTVMDGTESTCCPWFAGFGWLKMCRTGNSQRKKKKKNDVLLFDKTKEIASR